MCKFGLGTSSALPRIVLVVLLLGAETETLLLKKSKKGKSKASTTTPTTPLEDGTEDGISLTTSPLKCYNGATLEDISADNDDEPLWVCHCQKRTFGQWCEIVHPCYHIDRKKKIRKNDDACSGQGKCKIHPSEKKLDKLHKITWDDVSYTCKCPDELTGKDCETQRDCRDDSDLRYSCQNGGSCMYDEEEKKHVCLCPPGFRYPTCSERYDEELKKAIKELLTCSGQNLEGVLQCGEGGTCVETANGAVCECQAGYTGDRCDTLHCPNCRRGKCDEEGTCKSGCLSGYTGASCSTLVGSVQAVNLTLEGAYTTDLTDKSSKKYKKMSKAVTKFTTEAFDGEVRVKDGSIEFTEGSVVTKYNVVTKNADDSPVAIANALKANAGSFPLKEYSVDPSSISTAKLVQQTKKETSENTKVFVVSGLGLAVAVCIGLVIFVAKPTKPKRKNGKKRTLKKNRSRRTRGRSPQSRATVV